MNYLPDNPNASLRSVRGARPVLTVLRRTGTAVLSILLLPILIYTVCTAALRSGLTPDTARICAEQIDYASLPITLEGETVTLTEAVGLLVSSLGIPVSEEAAIRLFDQFSIPTVCGSLCQDLVSWLLFDGPYPAADPIKIAEIVLSRASEDIVSILAFLGGGDPILLVARILETPLAGLPLDGLCGNLEAIRPFLSVDALALLCSVCGVLGVLIFCLCGCSVRRFFLPAGTVLLLGGIASAVIGLTLPFGILYAVPDYGRYLIPLLSQVCRGLWLYALAGVGFGVLLLALWMVFFLRTRPVKAVPPPENPSPKTDILA